jgi:uncharacterized membrane protein
VQVLWPYCAGITILIIGLVMLARSEALHAPGVNKFLAFAPLFLAFPMAVFGGDHFMVPRGIAQMVPSWIPGHLFWAFFVGIALEAAALSIVLKRYSALAAALFGLMIFLFVLLIHLPNAGANIHDRFRLAVFLRDLSFSAGGFAFAITQAKQPPRVAPSAIVVIRTIIAVGALFFGVEHFLHAQNVPVIPLEALMPSWLPGHLLVSYTTGAVLIACGLCLIVNWKARLAATWLGIVVLVVVILIYLPILIANLSDINKGLNYFADTLLYSGAALALAGALPKD